MRIWCPRCQQLKETTQNRFLHEDSSVTVEYRCSTCNLTLHKVMLPKRRPNEQDSKTEQKDLTN